MSSSIENLTKIVIENSNAKNWQDSIKERDLIDTDEDESASSICVCGKTGIRYLHTIENLVNGNIIEPIGSCCIKKFNRADLNEKISIKEKLFKLYHAVENNEFIELDSTIFSRKLIDYLYEQGAFKSNNPRYDEVENYEFFYDMFNKRDKEFLSQRTKSKIRAIIKFNIIPFVKRQLDGKVHKQSLKGNYYNK